MNDIVIIFLIMLTLLTVMSAFGGGIRYRENFYEELATDQYFMDESLYNMSNAEDVVDNNNLINTNNDNDNGNGIDNMNMINNENIIFNNENNIMNDVYAEDNVNVMSEDNNAVSSDLASTTAVSSDFASTAAPVDFFDESSLPRPLPYTAEMPSNDNYDTVEPFDGAIYAPAN
jgi:hypothetical protein